MSGMPTNRSRRDFLKFSEGSFTRNIFKLTQHNLANPLRSALIRAQQKGDKFTYDRVDLLIGTHALIQEGVEFHDLGLVAIWDDGDDLYAEPRAPYPHTREVLLLRGQWLLEPSLYRAPPPDGDGRGAAPRIRRPLRRER